MLATPFLNSAWDWYHPLKTADKIALWAVVVSTGCVFASVVGGFIAALAGAKYGARAAFELGKVQQSEDLEDKRYGLLIETLYNLLLQYRTLEFFIKNLRSRDLELGVFFVPKPTAKIPFQNIIHTANRAPLLLHDIYDAEQQYLAALEMANEIRIKGRGKKTSSDIIGIEFLANDFKKHLKESLPKFENAINAVNAYIKQQFTDRLEIKDVYALVPPSVQKEP